MGASDTTEEEILLAIDIEDYKKALEWVKKISEYGEYINGLRKWSDNANKFIPILENAIKKAERYDDLFG